MKDQILKLRTENRELSYKLQMAHEALVEEGLGIFCENCGEFIYNNELREGQEKCDDCIEREERMSNWRKDCGV